MLLSVRRNTERSQGADSDGLLGTAAPNHSDCQVYLSISVGEFGGGAFLSVTL